MFQSQCEDLQQNLEQVSLFESGINHTLSLPNWHTYTSNRSRNAFFTVMHKGMTAGYMILWFAPIWIPAFVILFFILRWLRRWTMARIADWCARHPRTTPAVTASESSENKIGNS